MERKQIKKLRLNRETLRNLDDQELQKAGGGDTITGICSVCPTIRCTDCTIACTVCANC